MKFIKRPLSKIFNNISEKPQARSINLIYWPVIGLRKLHTQHIYQLFYKTMDHRIYTELFEQIYGSSQTNPYFATNKSIFSQLRETEATAFNHSLWVALNMAIMTQCQNSGKCLDIEGIFKQESQILH